MPSYKHVTYFSNNVFECASHSIFTFFQTDTIFRVAIIIVYMGNWRCYWSEPLTKTRIVFDNVFHELSLFSDTYDCIACSGGFGAGHIPSGALKEMVRLTKPGKLKLSEKQS